MSSETDVTRQLVGKMLALEYGRLPSEAVTIARQALMDWIGVTIAGRKEEVIAILGSHASAGTIRQGCGLIARDDRLPLVRAGFMLAAQSHALDYDDVNLAMPGHASVPVLATLWPLAEMLDSSPHEFLTAYVAGYEAVCRIARLVAPDHYDRGFQATATAGCLGATIGAARLLRLDVDTACTAVCIAASQIAGVKSVFGTMCKILQVGRAAENALTAIELARRGLTGRRDILECRQGFAAAYSNAFNPEEALAEPPLGLYLRSNLFKYHASCFETHPAIDAMARLAASGLRARDVKSIEIRVSPACDKICNIAAPQTGMEAKFSIRMMAAHRLYGTDTADPATYRDELQRVPDIVDLREKIVVVLDPSLKFVQTRVEVRKVNGELLTSEHDSSHPCLEPDEQGKRLEEKFRVLTRDTTLGANVRMVTHTIRTMRTLEEFATLRNVLHRSLEPQ